MKLHPQCTHAKVKLVGRSRASSIRYTFDSRGEQWQPMSDLDQVKWCLGTQGFVVHQYDKGNKRIVESGQLSVSAPQPVKVVKAGLAKDENWSMLELEDQEPPETPSEVETKWLAEQREAEADRKLAEQKGTAPASVKSEFGKLVPEADKDPIMGHVFGDSWSPTDGIFKLQSTARKRGIEFKKTDTKDDLIAALRASEEPKE